MGIGLYYFSCYNLPVLQKSQIVFARKKERKKGRSHCKRAGYQMLHPYVSDKPSLPSCAVIRLIPFSPHYPCYRHLFFALLTIVGSSLSKKGTCRLICNHCSAVVLPHTHDLLSSSFQNASQATQEVVSFVADFTAGL
jgi:hypothetical protein